MANQLNQVNQVNQVKTNRLRAERSEARQNATSQVAMSSIAAATSPASAASMAGTAPPGSVGIWLEIVSDLLDAVLEIADGGAERLAKSSARFVIEIHPLPTSAAHNVALD